MLRSMSVNEKLQIHALSFCSSLLICFSNQDKLLKMWLFSLMPYYDICLCGIIFIAGDGKDGFALSVASLLLDRLGFWNPIRFVK